MHTKNNKSLFTTRSGLNFIFAGLVFAGAGTQAFGQDAHFDGDRLIIPAILSNSVVYSVELQISGLPDPAGVYPFTPSPVMQMFEVASVEIVSIPSVENPSFWNAEKGFLTVPRIEVSGNYFWAQFTGWDLDPFALELIDFGVDDEDDDDDGISDLADPFPYSTSHDEDPLEIVGQWRFRREVVSDLSFTPCESFQDPTFHDVEITFDSEIDRYRISAGEASIVTDPLLQSGIAIDVNLPTGDGHMESFFDLNVYSSQLMMGSENWHWTGNVSGSCPNQTSIVHAVRQG